MAATASVPAVPAPAGRSRWIRLIPVAIIVYIISFDKPTIAPPVVPARDTARQAPAGPVKSGQRPSGP